VATYHKHYQSGEHSGICVIRRKGESDEDLLRRFRKKYSKSGISKELRERMFYEKPSNKKRRKKQQSIRLKAREEEKIQKTETRMTKIKLKKERKEREKRGAKNDSSRYR
jgi:small subunit ribosomal protein S21